MTQTLMQKITGGRNNAMRAKGSERWGAIRLWLAEIKRKEVDERIEVDDDVIAFARAWP